MSLTRPPIKYFGSKWTSARQYPEPRGSVIVEPFAGGAGYSCRHPEKKVFLFDLDPEVAALWKWLISADLGEILSLPVETLQQGQDLRDLPIRREAADLIRRWQRVGRNDCWTVSSWNNKPGLWQESVKQALCESIPRIRHWEAYCLDFKQIPTCLRGSTFFVDPPYQHVKGYRFERINYRELREYVQCWSAFNQTIVCEQEGADWLPFQVSHEVTSGRTKQGGTRHKSSEVLWVGGP